MSFISHFLILKYKFFYLAQLMNFRFVFLIIMNLSTFKITKDICTLKPIKLIDIYKNKIKHPH